MKTKVTILGAGPAGYIAAVRAAQLGADVTVVEAAELGGTCLNRGCIPTKTLRASAEAMINAERLSEFGLVLKGRVQPNMAEIMARKNKVVSNMVKGVEKLLRTHKINVLAGRGVVVNPHLVRVEILDGETVDIEGHKLILATGSQPMDIPGIPVDGQRIISSDHMLEMTDLPESVCILGGGVVGVELGFILNGLGVQVSIVEAMDRVVGLPSVDRASSTILTRELKKRKIKLYLKKTINGVTSAPDGRLKVTLGGSPLFEDLTEREKAQVEISAEKLLVSVGREPVSKHIGLNAMRIDTDDKGWVLVNDKMETNVPDVYAMGDLLGPKRVMLAHAATSEALVAAENCLGGNLTMDYSAVPVGIFSFPELASVGLTEEQALKQELAYRADSFLFRGLGKAQAMGSIAGQVKIVSEANTKKILGVHIIGPHATDLIGEATLAVRSGLTVEDMASTIHVHPSLSEALLEASHIALDRPLHQLPKDS